MGHRHKSGRVLSQLCCPTTKPRRLGLFRGAGRLSSNTHQRTCRLGPSRGHWGEKEGTYTNSERRVSKVNAATPPPGEARPDFDIFLELAKKLGCYGELFPGWTQPKDAFEEWKRVSAGRLCDYSGLDYQLLERHGGIQWPFPKDASEVKTTRLYSDGKFQTDDGKGRLLPVEWESFPEQPNADFPFVLNTGRTVEHWHTRTKTEKVPILEHLSPNAWLEMNPRDALALKLKAHDRVDIISPRGRVSSVELRVTEIVAPGQVFIPFHYAEANANRVTQSAFDPISREPNYKQCAVRVEKSRPAPQFFGVRGSPKTFRRLSVNCKAKIHQENK